MIITRLTFIRRQGFIIFKTHAILILFAISMAILGLSIATFLKDSPPTESVITKQLGLLYTGQRITNSFVLENPLDEVLKIVDIKDSCGCISYKISKTEIQAGGSAVLEVTYQLADKVGDARMTTLVLTETLKRRKLRHRFIIDVRGRTARVIEVARNQPIIQIGEFQVGGDAVERAYRITRGQHSMQWDTLTCECTNDDVNAKVTKVAANEWNLELSMKNPSVIGDIRSHLTFCFWKDGKRQAYNLVRPMEVGIIGPFVSSPKSVLFGTVSCGEKVEKFVRVVSTQQQDHRPIVVLSADSTDVGELQTKVMNRASEQGISIIFRAGDKKGTREGSVVITAQVDKTIYRMNVRYLASVL
jgi:hypothetical protein